MIYEILTVPDARLKQKSTPVEKFDATLAKFVEDMFETMEHADHAVGLAAPQIGVFKRILIADLNSEETHRGKDARVVINPQIIEASEESNIRDEYCFSIPFVGVPVRRSLHIRVRYQDIRGAFHEEALHDMWARLFLHEYDHLEGILTLDYASKLKRDLILKRIKKLKAAQKM